MVRGVINQCRGRALVTGASGFVGEALSSKLYVRGFLLSVW